MSDISSIIKSYVGEEGKLNDLFTQLFVQGNNTLDYSFFMKHHGVQATYSAINAALKEVTGSKAVRFTETESFPPIMENFINSIYRFGAHENARTWIQVVFDTYGVVLNRREVLGWIATQRPAKSTSSFLPSDDRNLYGSAKE